ncbi:MAG: DUF2309 domain-containing protein [Bdellovibrionales bacterium]|nr:DUF2309 domain-containing protein [Bdellovibrionales bacterium]
MNLSEISLAIDGACKKIAPLWPLNSFVAVNPFLGFIDKPFSEACASFRRINRADVLMPRGFYREAIQSGVMEDRDLAAALSLAPSNWPVPQSVEVIKTILENVASDQKPPRAVVATVSEVLDKLAHGDRHSSRTAFMIDEIAKFCASYYDSGQALLPFPLKEKSLYSAWLAWQKIDRNPEFMGLSHFRETVAEMPTDPVEAIAFVTDKLSIPARATEDYLYRALFDINGWASFVRHLVWKSELYGETNDSLVQLLAIRVVWGYGLFLERQDPAFIEAWKASMNEAARLPRDHDLKHDPNLALDLVLHEAYERAHQRKLLKTLTSLAQIAKTSGAIERPPLQAVFCIDVRSEVYRRALESSYPGVETIGFAGFFGVPFEFLRLGNEKGSERGPVLLKTGFRVLEAPLRKEDRAAFVTESQIHSQSKNAWRRFTQSATACFAYVEALGFFSLVSLIKNTLGLRKIPHKENIVPIIDQEIIDGEVTGFTREQKLQVAKSVLKNMGLNQKISRLVLFVGHGSETINNPHASGLDCGACGGHSGDANARVVSTILNDPEVRLALGADGLNIPEDTWFLGALHNTTTDEITLFGTENAPAFLRSEIDELQVRLNHASRLARAERSTLLGIKKDKADSDVIQRCSDWSQVRPEWGLAGNYAFIVGPRSLTSSARLNGQAFLHSYDWKTDPDFSVLELIMTAPMIVASWINLQYFASTTNNPVFGAGNKTIHNVIGTLGVIEGNSGDLKVGLPWQSVHDGTQFVHKPLRLNVVIAAPTSAISGIIQKHSHVRHLLDNNWMNLFAQSDDGRGLEEYVGNLNWKSATVVV